MSGTKGIDTDSDFLGVVATAGPDYATLLQGSEDDCLKIML
jgi:hypothetical protein